MSRIKTILMIGGGHGHLYLLKQLMTEKIPGYRIVLISEGRRQYYSGMAAAYMEDIYTDQDISVDLKKICDAGHVTFIEGIVEFVEPVKKYVVTQDGTKHYFDLASFDTGSRTMIEHIPGAGQFGKKVKPLEELSEIKSMIKTSTINKTRIVIIGGGSSSVELSLAIKKYGMKQKKELEVTVISGNSGILSDYKMKLRKIGEKKLRKEKVNVIKGTRVTAIKKNDILMTAGMTMPFDLVLLATGSTAHPLYKVSGLKTDKKGYMMVNPYLQNVAYPYIFGIGDCIAFEDYTYVKKVGVYAVREAEFLWTNLNNFINNEELMAYKPQKKYLSILSLGDKIGVLEFHGIVAAGKWVWQLKNRIDVSFIKQFQ